MTAIFGIGFIFSFWVGFIIGKNFNCQQNKQDKTHNVLHCKASPEKAKSRLKYGRKSLHRLSPVDSY